MIISHGRKYIFVHIPKTGGTSMALALEARALKDDIMIGDTPKAVKRRRRLTGVKTSGRLWKHSRLGDVYGLIGDDEINRYHVFTLVRNPWDRMVSYYTWLQAQDFEHVAVSTAKRTSFSDFIHTPEIAASIKASHYGSYIQNRHGQEVCQSFIRLEHLEGDLPLLETALGIRIAPLSRQNSSNRLKNYQDFYTQDDRDWVAVLCALDIDRFGYVF